MKRFSLITLFLLTTLLPIFAAVGDVIDSANPKDSNLVFTVLNEDAKTVSVKAKRKDYYGPDSILNIPASVTTNSGDTYTVTTIAADGFKKIQIKQIILPATIKKIDTQAFREITTTFTIELNEGLEEIGNRVFCRSTGLTGTLVLPSTLKNIYSSAAFLSLSISQIIINTPVPPTFTKNENTTYPIPNVPIVIPCNTYDAYANTWSAYTSQFIDPCIFSDGTYTYQVLPEDDSKVAVKALVDNSIQHVTFSTEVTNPDNDQTYLVAKIGDNCFKDNATITSVTLPPSLISIGASAFYKCKNLQTISLNEGLAFIGEKAFVGLSDIQGTTIIPSTVDTIGDYAFADWVTPIQFLSEVPAALGGIQVFRDALKQNSSIIIPCGTYEAYNKVKNWNIWLSRIVDPCLFSFSDGTYTYQVLPEDDSKVAVKALVDNSIQHVTFSTEVTNPDNDQTYLVAKIGDNCFKDNATITSVTLPPSLISIGAFAFYNCKKLQSISLNEGLKTIGARSFAHDSLVTGTLTIPSSVSLIETRAFYNFLKIEKIEVLAETPPAIDSLVFSALPNNATISIPCGSLNLYQNANYWKDLSSKFISACKPLTLKKGEALTQDTTVSSISFSRTFPMNQWQALYLPFEMDSMLVYDDGYWDAYFPFNSEKPTEGGYFYLYGLKSIDTNSGLFTFQEVHELNSNTPYMMLFIDKNTTYFEDKEIVFKSKQGEYRLTDNYTEPTLGAAYQLHGNNSLWEHSLTDGYTLSSSCDSCAQGIYDYKFWFSHNDNAPVLPFSWVVTPTKDIASKIMPAPRFLAGRWGYQPSSGGGDTPTSMQTVSESKVTYTQTGSQLTLYTQGQPCKVYAIDGTLLLSTDGTQDEISIELNQGLYIIYSNGQSQKVLF